jgi:hypothetical protein
VNSSNNNTLCLRCAELELELKRIQLELKSAEEIVKLLLKEEINNSEKSEVNTHYTQTETGSDKLAINQWYKLTKKYKKMQLPHLWSTSTNETIVKNRYEPLVNFQKAQDPNKNSNFNSSDTQYRRYSVPCARRYDKKVKEHLKDGIKSVSVHSVSQDNIIQ